MCEGHDADDDAYEASQQGEDHEGTGGVQVCCEGKGQRSDAVFWGQSRRQRCSFHWTRVGLVPHTHLPSLLAHTHFLKLEIFNCHFLS